MFGNSTYTYWSTYKPTSVHIKFKGRGTYYTMEHLGHSHMNDSDNSTLLENTTSLLVSTAASMISPVITAESTGAHQHSMEGDPTAEMGMQMWFYFSRSAIVLFREWDIKTVGGMVGSVIGIILLSILYEGLKFFREHLFRSYYNKISYSTCAVTGANGGPCGDSAELRRVTQNRLLSMPHMVQTLLHMVQIILSYFLMLIFMTYNVWLCIAVVIGSGLGYFFFGWKKSTAVDISDHCH